MNSGDIIKIGPPTWKVQHVINDKVYSIRMDAGAGVEVNVCKVTVADNETYEVNISKRGLTKAEAMKWAETLAWVGGGVEKS